MTRNFYLSSNRLGPDGGTNSTQGGSHGIDTQRDAKVIHLKPLRLPLTNGRSTLPLPLPTRQLTQEARMLPPSFSETIVGPPLPFVARHPLWQAVVDVVAVLVGICFLCVTAGAIVVGGAMLYFGSF